LTRRPYARLGKSLPVGPAFPILRVKISPGVVLFYPPPDFNVLKLNDLRMVSRLHFRHAWGRRAEDPFRGLRAGPARTSPHFFRNLQLFQPCKRLAPKTPQNCFRPTGAGECAFLFVQTSLLPTKKEARGPPRFSQFHLCRSKRPRLQPRSSIVCEMICVIG